MLHAVSVILITTIMKSILCICCCFVNDLCKCAWLIITVSIAVIAETTIHLDDLSKQHESVIIAIFKAFYKFGKFIAAGVSLQFLIPSSSIAALFVCENRSGLKNIVELYALGKLQSMLEEFFTSLLLNEFPEAVVHIKKLIWELSDHCRCSLYFNPLPKCELFLVDHVACICLCTVTELSII